MAEGIAALRPDPFHRGGDASSPRVALEWCASAVRTSIGIQPLPNTCRNQRRGPSAVSVFAAQQPTGWASQVTYKTAALPAELYEAADSVVRSRRRAA